MVKIFMAATEELTLQLSVPMQRRGRLEVTPFYQAATTSGQTVPVFPFQRRDNRDLLRHGASTPEPQD